MEKWDQTQQCSCPADGERSVTLPKCSLFQGTWKKISINIQGRVWVETWAWPWGHLGVLHGLEEGYSGQTLPCWWGEGERSGAEATPALNSGQLGEHGSVLRQMGLILLLFKKKVTSLLGKYSLISLLPVQLSREEEPCSWWATFFHGLVVCVNAFAVALLCYFLVWNVFQLSC